MNDRLPTIVPPVQPLPSEIEALENISKGAGLRKIELHFQEVSTYNQAWQARIDIAKEDAKAIRAYRMYSLFAGFGLGLLAFILAGFGIHNKTSILELTGLVGAISGIAGVFVWGYRPKD